MSFNANSVVDLSETAGAYLKETGHAFRTTHKTHRTPSGKRMYCGIIMPSDLHLNKAGKPLPAPNRDKQEYIKPLF